MGAILSNSTGTMTQLRNGALYRCPINGGSSCINMAVDDTGLFIICFSGGFEGEPGGPQPQAPHFW